MQAAWASAGVSIPRTTYEQWAALRHVPMPAIQPGDLIFFNSEGHVAVYVGNNQIIDAPQPRSPAARRVGAADQPGAAVVRGEPRRRRPAVTPALVAEPWAERGGLCTYPALQASKRPTAPDRCETVRLLTVSPSRSRSWAIAIEAQQPPGNSPPGT